MSNVTVGTEEQCLFVDRNVFLAPHTPVVPRTRPGNAVSHASALVIDEIRPRRGVFISVLSYEIFTPFALLLCSQHSNI